MPHTPDSIVQILSVDLTLQFKLLLLVKGFINDFLLHVFGHNSFHELFFECRLDPSALKVLSHSWDRFAERASTGLAEIIDVFFHLLRVFVVLLTFVMGRLVSHVDVIPIHLELVLLCRFCHDLVQLLVLYFSGVVAIHIV